MSLKLFQSFFPIVKIISCKGILSSVTEIERTMLVNIPTVTEKTFCLVIHTDNQGYSLYRCAIKLRLQLVKQDKGLSSLG